jgi:hypothetical protein
MTIPSKRLGALLQQKAWDSWYRQLMWCHLVNEPFVWLGDRCPVCEGDLSAYHEDEGTHEAIGLIVPPWKVRAGPQEGV